MALYKGSLRVCPIVPRWRGFWAVTVKGFPGTIVDCGTQKTIGESGSVIFKFAEAGTYTFVAEYGGEVQTKTITLVDGTYFMDAYMYVGYTLLEYVANNKPQSGNNYTYFNTNYIPNNNTRLDLDIIIHIEQTSSAVWPAGGREGYLSKAFGFYYDSSHNKLYYAFGDDCKDYSITSSLILGKKLNINIDKTGLYLDGEKIIIPTYSTFLSPVPLFIGILNNNGTISSAVYWNIYKCKVWDNNILMRDFIPVKRNSDNKPGMLDLVSGQFFTNAGSGELTPGPEVE